MSVLTGDAEHSEATSPLPRPVRRRSPGVGRVLLTALACALVGAGIASVGTGAFAITPGEIVATLAHRVGLEIGTLPDATTQAVLVEVRLPRVVLGVLVGAALGCAGAVLQGVFGNPLAEPGIIGVSLGATAGAVLSIGLGIATFGAWSTPVAAFVGGLLTTLVVYGLSRSGRRTEVVTLVLTGIGINALAGGAVGLVTYYADDAELRSITFWNLGSVGAATWPTVLATAPWALAGLLAAPACARRLDLLALGDGPARHLGVDVERTRLACIVLVAVLTAAAVAVSGVITFVGLVVPHLLRLVAGPGHRILIPGSALGGALVIVLGDLAARTLAAPAEIPLGVLTALIGAPFFLWLLRRTRAHQGGWA
jgi:iron complex transport system permease protein